ncbi:hypothetical protein IJG21_00785 [Candidatus Saccharibacteria bacterium]|nr:hypothetical protein [Candidatus Saccharibacteria bacterium]
MFNFLKKNSRVFLIFLALLLSFSSILNLSVPAFADDPPAGDTAGATTGDGTGTGSDGAPATSSADSKQMEKKCKKIVGALGWIMCPLVFSTAKGVSNLYNYVENNFMQVRTSFFTAKLSEAWGKFRNVANIFFIVLFFIVIISQLTGVGIDNYGIKRIMPRLVIVAILINLSYIVCQLVTDVSNIVGYGAAQTISELGGNYEGVGSDSYIEIAINEEKSQYIRIVLTNGVVGVVGAGELLVVLLCLVIALLSTFIIWIFCLARDIGIIVMVMASPLAFACMLLPNTEGLYKKWFNLSKILWTLYPICGVTLGIGTFVSVFVYNNTSGTFLSGVAALLTATLPFVAIPYLLLNALSAFGTIGSKISNWGRGKLNAGWRTAGRPVSSTAKMAGRGALGVAGAAAKLPLGITKDALRKVSSTGAGKKVSSTYGKVKEYTPGALSKKAGEAYSGTKFGKTETGKALGNLVNAPVSAVKNTAKEAVEATKYEVKKPLANMAKADAEKRLERANIDNWTNPVRRAASEAAMISKQQSDDIKARESLIMSDKYKFMQKNASGIQVETTLDHSSIDQLGAALRYTMSNDYRGSEENRKSDIAALTNRLFALGDSGRTKTAEVYESLVGSGEANRNGVLAYGQNIMDYHAADAKTNQRTIYEVANKIVNDNANSNGTAALTDIKMSDFAGRKYGKLKLEQYATIDDEEVNRIEQALNYQPGVSPVGAIRLTDSGSQADETAAKQEVLQAIQSALSDKQISSTFKGERKAQLERIIASHRNEFTPAQKEPTPVYVVPHSGRQNPNSQNGNGSTPTP